MHKDMHKDKTIGNNSRFDISQTVVLDNNLQGLSKDLESECPKLPIVNFGGILFFKGGHNILRFQPQICFYLLK